MLGARSVRTLAALALVGASSVVASPALADDPPSEQAAIVPPRLLAPVPAGYPDGAEGDASVVVAVTVAADGSVQNARVLEGSEPFASRAIEAVGAARFVPATRGGVPLAATIRFRIDFAKAAPPPPPAPVAPTPPPAAA